MNKISIIVPCYNEDAALPIYYKEMCKIMAASYRRGRPFRCTYP